jgi:hypothetical protein
VCTLPDPAAIFLPRALRFRASPDADAAPPPFAPSPRTEPSFIPTPARPPSARVLGAGPMLPARALQLALNGRPLTCVFRGLPLALVEQPPFASPAPPTSTPQRLPWVGDEDSEDDRDPGNSPTPRSLAPRLAVGELAAFRASADHARVKLTAINPALLPADLPAGGPSAQLELVLGVPSLQDREPASDTPGDACLGLGPARALGSVSVAARSLFAAQAVAFVGSLGLGSASKSRAAGAGSGGADPPTEPFTVVLNGLAVSVLCLHLPVYLFPVATVRPLVLFTLADPALACLAQERLLGWCVAEGCEVVALAALPPSTPAELSTLVRVSLVAQLLAAENQPASTASGTLTAPGGSVNGAETLSDGRVVVRLGQTVRTLGELCSVQLFSLDDLPFASPPADTKQTSGGARAAAKASLTPAAARAGSGLRAPSPIPDLKIVLNARPIRVCARWLDVKFNWVLKVEIAREPASGRGRGGDQAVAGVGQLEVEHSFVAELPHAWGHYATLVYGLLGRFGARGTIRAWATPLSACCGLLTLCRFRCLPLSSISLST